MTWRTVLKLNFYNCLFNTTFPELVGKNSRKKNANEIA